MTKCEILYSADQKNRGLTVNVEALSGYITSSWTYGALLTPVVYVLIDSRLIELPGSTIMAIVWLYNNSCQWLSQVQLQVWLTWLLQSLTVHTRTTKRPTHSGITLELGVQCTVICVKEEVYIQYDIWFHPFVHLRLIGRLNTLDATATYSNLTYDLQRAASIACQEVLCALIDCNIGIIFRTVRVVFIHVHLLALVTRYRLCFTTVAAEFSHCTMIRHRWWQSLLSVQMPGPLRGLEDNICFRLWDRHRPFDRSRVVLAKFQSVTTESSGHNIYD